MKKTLKYLFYGVFVLGFVWVSAQLFFERRTNDLLTSAMSYFEAGKPAQSLLKDLRIIYPDVPQSLEPTLNDPVVRQRINNMYEPLLRTDRDLTMRPALAVSWGLIDDKTWDFRLRDDVVFHDGSTFDALDVVASLSRAKNHEASQLPAVLASIEKVEVIDDMRIAVKTYQPDPLLLQRMSTVLILPSEYEEEAKFLPVGTGSYKFENWTEDGVISLSKFNDYWGPEAKFEKVEMISKPAKNERVGMFLNGDADFLAFVPFDAAAVVQGEGFEVVGMPSLEVQFLMFNFESKNLADFARRQTLSLAIDQSGLTGSLGKYARPVSQFVGNGVFGFNPDIKPHEYDLKKAGKMAAEAGLDGKTLTFHLPLGLNVLGEHVRKQLLEIGVNVAVSYLEPSDFVSSLKEKKADIYFLGFKADLGDSGDFLDAVVHSDAEFNIANYSNAGVDDLIEKSLKELDPSVRIINLQEAMRILIEDDVIGVPLFEYETLYGFSDRLDFEPRIDGFIYFDELILL